MRESSGARRVAASSNPAAYRHTAGVACCDRNNPLAMLARRSASAELPISFSRVAASAAWVVAGCSLSGAEVGADAAIDAGADAGRVASVCPRADKADKADKAVAPSRHANSVRVVDRCIARRITLPRPFDWRLEKPKEQEEQQIRTTALPRWAARAPAR